MEKEKSAVRDFWDAASCGEDLYLKGADARAKFEHQALVRYQLEPYILSFAEFSVGKGKKVLEIGVGLGADHQQWAAAGAILSGCDLTPRAVDYTRERLQLFGLSSDLQEADAENLPYENDQFEIIYSWGVIHHSPKTHKAVEEIHRVLQTGGIAKIMVYHKYSFVGYMLWVRYALLKLKPFTSLSTIYAKYLESPGTKAYSKAEARLLFSGFADIDVSTVLTHGDLLTSAAGQRHKGVLLNIARKIWPRWIIRTFFPGHGLFLLIKVRK
jgi:ubiquinone/menaquinone biosynthesis C-methylase UbiE